MSEAATIVTDMAAAERAQGRPPDAEAATRRAAARVERVEAGLAELDRWIADQVRAGLAPWERAGGGPFEAVAARLVDAQAPGVAGMVRAIPALLGQDNWPRLALDALAGLHLLVTAHAGLDRLPPDLAATVRSRIGYPVAKAQVLAGAGVADHWWAAGSVDVVEGRLESRRTWLWGTTTRRWALLLSFAVPGAGLDETVRPGQTVSAALHFYPGAGEHRALVGQQGEPWSSVSSADLTPESLPQAARRWAAQVAADPWATRMPVLLRGRVSAPAGPRRRWRIGDPDGSVIPLVGLSDDPWPLLALSTGDPVTVFGEWGRTGLRPLRIVLADADVPAGGGPRLLAVTRP